MIQYRLNNIELREREHPTCPLEIVQWNDSQCWTIALWEKNKDDIFQMRFIGSRPFDDKIDWYFFGELAKTGQIYLSNLNHE